MSSQMLFCDRCGKVHAFPRDMAQPERESRLMLAVAVIAQVAGAAIIAALLFLLVFAWLLPGVK